MANLAALVTDVPAEIKATLAFVAGVQKLVSDAKAQGLTSVAISDVEALVPEGELVFQDGEKVVADI